MNIGIRHLVKRKIATQKPQPTLSLRESFWRHLSDTVMYVVAIVSPLFVIPQVVQVYGSHQTAGLSLGTWSAFTILNLLWAWYGWMHSERPLLTASILIALFDGSVVLGILLYH